MAYADANTSRRKLSATVAVVALEAGVAWALITGLAYTRLIQPEIHTGGFPIPSPTPTIIPPPTEPPPPKGPVVVPSPRVPLGPTDPEPAPTTQPTSTPTGGETGTGPDPKPTVEPTPTPSPKPLFQPKAAKPRGDSSRWLSTDDYPLRSIRERQEGRTGYRLAIDASGRITACTITSSSGHSELDQAACRLLPRRAKFDAARDDTGAPVAGTFTGNVQWRLPPED
jgi:protein TonB